MKVNVSNEGRYVPKWMDNRSLPEDEQIVVEFTALSHDQRKKYVHYEKPSYSIETAGKTDKEVEDQLEAQTSRVEFKAWTDNDKIAVASKITITNLESEAGDPIDTWDKLLACPQTKQNQLSVLVTEVETEFGNLSKEKDSGNSE